MTRHSPLLPGARALAPGSQRACYLPWLKVSVAPHALTFPWAPEAWREVRQHIPWPLAEHSRIRTGWMVQLAGAG